MSSTEKAFEFNFPLPETRESFTPTPQTDSRRKPNGNKVQIQNLWERHHKIKRLLFIGWQQKDIAHEMGMTKEAISIIANSEVMKRELELMRGAADVKALDVRAQIDENARKAAVLLHEFMTDEANEPSLRAKIAMDQLSRAGYAPQVNIKGNIQHTHFTMQEIEEIKRVALEGVNPPVEEENTIDVPFSEVN